jgi:hypothetical protein
MSIQYEEAEFIIDNCEQYSISKIQKYITNNKSNHLDLISLNHYELCYELKKEQFFKKFLKPTIDKTNYKSCKKTVYKTMLYLKNLRLPNVTLSFDNIIWNANYMMLVNYSDGLTITSKFMMELHKCNTKYFICLLNLQFINHSTNKMNNHCNVLTFNLVDKMIEIFEPHGTQNELSFSKKYELHDLSKKLNFYFPSFTVNRICNEIGIQSLQELEPVRRFHYETDPNGFCAIFCIWYIESRFSNLNINLSSSEILTLYIKILKTIAFNEEKDLKI